MELIKPIIKYTVSVVIMFIFTSCSIEDELSITLPESHKTSDEAYVTFLSMYTDLQSGSLISIEDAMELKKNISSMKMVQIFSYSKYEQGEVTSPNIYKITKDIDRYLIEQNNPFCRSGYTQFGKYSKYDSQNNQTLIVMQFLCK